MHEKLDKSRPTIAVFLDLAKGFDTVNHELLLKKIENYRIRGIAYSMIKNYLSNKKQTVKINDNYSAFRDIEIGVSQGTILGPLLFLLYIHDIFEIGKEGDIVSYADDTVVLASEET